MSIFENSEETKTAKIGTQNIKVTTKKGSVDLATILEDAQFDQEVVWATLHLEPNECWELGEFLLRSARKAGYADPVEPCDFSELEPKEGEYPF